MKTLKFIAASFLAFLFLGQVAQAQDDGPNTKGEAGDIGIGFNYDLTPNINFGGLFGGGAGGVSAGNNWRNDAFGNAQIFGRYYLSDDMVVRASLGLNSNSSTNFDKDSTQWGETVVDGDGTPQAFGADSLPYSETESSSSQFNFSISPGIEKHIATDNNLDPYVGAQIPLAFLGKTKTDSTVSREGYNSFNGNKNTYEYSSNREQPGGFGWGLQGIVGFNWFIDDKVAIGMEYTLGFMRVAQGGEISGGWEEEGSAANTTEDDGDIWNHQSETTNGGIQTMSRGGINVSIFF